MMRLALALTMVTGLMSCSPRFIKADYDGHRGYWHGGYGSSGYGHDGYTSKNYRHDFRQKGYVPTRQGEKTYDYRKEK